MEANMATIFDLRDVSYSYVGKIDALKDISLIMEKEYTRLTLEHMKH